MRRFFWFAVAGVGGLLVDVGVLLGLQPWLGPYVARCVSFVCAATFTWAVNRRFAFQGLSAQVGLAAEYLRYLGLMLGGGLVNYLAYAALISLLGTQQLILAMAVAVGSLAGMTANYLGARHLLYRG